MRPDATRAADPQHRARARRPSRRSPRHRPAVAAVALDELRRTHACLNSCARKMAARSAAWSRRRGTSSTRRSATLMAVSTLHGQGRRVPHRDGRLTAPHRPRRPSSPAWTRLAKSPSAIWNAPPSSSPALGRSWGPGQLAAPALSLMEVKSTRSRRPAPDQTSPHVPTTPTSRRDIEPTVTRPPGRRVANMINNALHAFRRA